MLHTDGISHGSNQNPCLNFGLTHCQRFQDTEQAREHFFADARQKQEKSNVVPLKMVAMNISDRAQRSSKVDQVSQEGSQKKDIHFPDSHGDDEETRIMS